MSSWQALGEVAPRELHETRLQLHWAAQLVAAVGSSLVPAKPDDSHTALTCIVDRSLLVSEPTPRRAALSLPDLRLVVLDENLAELGALALDGTTLGRGLEWIASALGTDTLELPDYDMPSHPIQDGASFRHDPSPSFEELTRWFTNAARLLRDLDIGTDRIWPHHFDLASLVELGGDESIGVGLSPGDGSYDQPYWYVTPWPYPAGADLPGLPSGHWHTEGFVAAILTGSDITEAQNQRAHVEAFLEAAIRGSRRLLGVRTE